MATKLDIEKPLFLGKTPVREATTNGQIRKAVHELDKGEGVSYADLEKHMLENYKPAKSENYGPAFIKAYVRDAVNKFGHLSHENLGAEYAVVAPAEKKVAETAEVKAKPLTKAKQAQADVLAFVRDKGEVSSSSDLDSTKISSTMIMEETKKKQKTVDKMIADLTTEGFVRTDQVEGNEGQPAVTYVFLTEAGLKYVNETSPVVTGKQAETQSEGTAAETAETDTSEA